MRCKSHNSIMDSTALDYPTCLEGGVYDLSTFLPVSTQLKVL